MTARWLKQSGSVWRAVAGSALGAVGAILLAEPLHLNQRTGALMAAIGLLSLAGALAGFHSRQQRHDPRRDADLDETATD